MKAQDMTIGLPYNFIGHSERLIYIGNNWSGNGYWHQFEKVDEPDVVWCEILNTELHLIERTYSDTEANQ